MSRITGSGIPIRPDPFEDMGSESDMEDWFFESGSQKTILCKIGDQNYLITVDVPASHLTDEQMDTILRQMESSLHPEKEVSFYVDSKTMEVEIFKGGFGIFE